MNIRGGAAAECSIPGVTDPMLRSVLHVAEAAAREAGDLIK